MVLPHEAEADGSHRLWGWEVVERLDRELPDESEMDVQQEITGKRHEEVLSHCRRVEEGPSVEPAGLAGEPALRTRRGDRPPSEGPLKPRCESMNRVSLGHENLFVSAAGPRSP
jgi:hypothetical protein